jgi:hypothetical protein
MRPDRLVMDSSVLFLVVFLIPFKLFLARYLQSVDAGGSTMLVCTIEGLSDMLIRYNYTANLSRGNWAWEFARRNRALRDDAFAVLPQLEAGRACHGIRLLKLDEPDLAAETWGLLYFPDPDQTALSTDVFWSDPAFPRKIAVHVRDREPGEIDEIFERGTRLCRIVHLTDAAGREHILVKGANCSIQIRCNGKSLLCAEPVKMEFSLPGFGCPDAYIDALKRAHRVYDPEAISPTWSHKALGYRNALIALDAHAAGLNYRETAMILHGEARVAEDWSSGSHAMKSAMARLLAKGRKLRDGGYRDLLMEQP